MTCCPRNTLQLALGAALAARRPKLVGHLLGSQGSQACAVVIAAWPIRQIADVLSILPRAEQAEIFMHLPVGRRTQLMKMGIPGSELPAVSGSASAFDKLKNRLLQACPVGCLWLARHVRMTKNPRFCSNTNLHLHLHQQQLATKRLSK